jgi:hypothetical protein
MTLSGERRNAGRKNSPSAISLTVNPTWTGVGSESCLCREKIAIDGLGHNLGRIGLNGYVGRSQERYLNFLQVLRVKEMRNSRESLLKTRRKANTRET